jgi:hypothetical protein
VQFSGKPDQAWFNDKLKMSKFRSWRALAPNLFNRKGAAIDPAEISRLLNGDRGVDIWEARQLADLLRQPLGEVLRRLGIAFTPKDGRRK